MKNEPTTNWRQNVSNLISTRSGFIEHSSNNLHYLIIEMFLKIKERKTERKKGLNSKTKERKMSIYELFFLNFIYWLLFIYLCLYFWFKFRPFFVSLIYSLTFFLSFFLSFLFISVFSIFFPVLVLTFIFFFFSYDSFLPSFLSLFIDFFFVCLLCYLLS